MMAKKQARNNIHFQVFSFPYSFLTGNTRHCFIFSTQVYACEAQDTLIAPVFAYLAGLRGFDGAHA